MDTAIRRVLEDGRLPISRSGCDGRACDGVTIMNGRSAGPASRMGSSEPDCRAWRRRCGRRMLSCMSMLRRRYFAPFARHERRARCHLRFRGAGSPFDERRPAQNMAIAHPRKLVSRVPRPCCSASEKLYSTCPSTWQAGQEAGDEDADPRRHASGRAQSLRLGGMNTLGVAGYREKNRAIVLRNAPADREASTDRLEILGIRCSACCLPAPPSRFAIYAKSTARPGFYLGHQGTAQACT